MARFLQKLGFGTSANNKKQTITTPRSDFIRNVQDPRGVQVLPVPSHQNQAQNDDSSNNQINQDSQGSGSGPSTRETININDSNVRNSDKKKGEPGNLKQANGTPKESWIVTRNASSSGDSAHRNQCKNDPNINNVSHDSSHANRRKSPPRRQRNTSGGKSSGSRPNVSSAPNVNSSISYLNHISNSHQNSGQHIPPIPAPRDKHRHGFDVGHSASRIDGTSPEGNRVNLRRPNSESPQIDHNKHPPVNRSTVAAGSILNHPSKSKPDVVILSEYSDPADLKRVINEKIYSEEDYTEPYELQKLKNAFQSQNLVLPVGLPVQNKQEIENGVSTSHDSSGKIPPPNVQKTPTRIDPDTRPAEEYDAPWEYTSKLNKASAGDPANGALVGAVPSTGNSKKVGDLPVSPERVKPGSASGVGASVLCGSDQTAAVSQRLDGRPPEEYDTPWEWVTHKNTDAAAAAALNTDCKKRSPNLKLTISSSHPPAIDASIPLEQQKWYHGAISRCDAEDLLKASREGSFLVRQSESNKQDYSLSLKSAHGYMHMKIVCESGEGYVLGQYSSPFTSIPAMISFYTEHKLPIRGAEHMSLLHPVHEQLL